MATYLITGANRIGYEYCRQLQAREKLSLLSVALL